MKLFKIETGAIWWVAAPNAHRAVAEWVRCMHGEGAVDEIPDELDLYDLDELGPECEAKLSANSDEDAGCRIWDVAQEESEPCVIACSEWP